MTVTINVTAANLDRLAEGLKIAPAVLEEASVEAMQKSVLLVEADVKALTPRVTGRLFSSIGHAVDPTVGKLRGSVGTAVNYAPYVEEGRGPIVAKAKALRFRGRDGKIIYRRAVGPALGRHMFRVGLQTAMPAVRQFFVDAVKKVADAAKGR